MTGTGQTLGGIGAMPYVPYTAIELVGNIQATSLGVLIICCLCVWFSDKKASDLSRLRLRVWGYSFYVALATFVISTFVRIWL